LEKVIINRKKSNIKDDSNSIINIIPINDLHMNKSDIKKGTNNIKKLNSKNSMEDIFINLFVINITKNAIIQSIENTKILKFEITKLLKKNVLEYVEME